MCGFILWINARWQAYRKARGYGPWDAVGPADHRAFDRELKEEMAARDGVEAPQKEEER